PSCMSSSESALVVLVPEAEAVVKPFRDQYDPSAAAGMPAHITLLYPFKTPDEVDQMTLDSLRDCFACFEPIPFSLGTIQRFPNEVLYLAPEPDESFRQLTLSIWNLFPETPPYGGKWPDIIPHLSVAQLATNNSSPQLQPTSRWHLSANCRSARSRPKSL
ncbi:MAG TPA: 2'-5' RNA ligase family protein, partial [Bradyrhizobium sp.]|nr:2'-5' RNA ligase family protein [Bradyrhizobium sp.]